MTNKILSHTEYINKLKNKNEFHLTFGGQYNAFLSDADITILVGNRGSAKSTTLLAIGLQYIHNKNFNGYILRKEIKDLTAGGSIISESKKMYSQFGELRESLQLLDWNFKSGAKISFVGYSSPIDEFKERVQGKQVDIIFVDEVTQMPKSHFSILMANLRNTKSDIRPQIFGACNPDADSWIKELIHQYIDFNSKYHTHKEEMNGKILYFFQTGNDITESVFAETKEEVYLMAKDSIDEIVSNSNLKNANPLDAILSIRCFYMPKSENIHIMKSKGGGLALDARMQMMTMQERIYAIYGGWIKIDSTLNSLIKDTDLEKWFNNSEMRSGVRYASMDIAGQGRDKTYIIIWDGYHIENIHTCKIKDAKSLIEWTIRILKSENVPINKNNFVYDFGGLGWAFSGHFDDDEAFKFITQANSSENSKIDGCYEKKIKIYSRAKDEITGIFLDVLKNNNGSGECGLSINKDILDTVYYGKTLRKLLTGESRGIEWKNSLDGIRQLIPTKEMNLKIGWHSDILFAIIYRFALDISVGNNFEQLNNDDDWSDFYYFLV